MGKYSSGSENEKRSGKSSKNRGRYRSSSSGSSDSRRNRRPGRKANRRSRSKTRYLKSRRSRSSSYSSKSRTRRSSSKERSKYRQNDFREKHRRSKSRDRYRSRRSRSKSYIREYTSKPKQRSPSTSSSSSSNGKDRNHKLGNSKLSKANSTSGISLKTNLALDGSPDCVIIDSKLLDQINQDKFIPKQFSSSKSNKIMENIVIDLNKQTIKVPDVEQTEPDSIFHDGLRGSNGEMDKRSLFLPPESLTTGMEKRVTMNHLRLHLLIYSVLLGVMLHVISNRTPNILSEKDTCPFCYGEDYCSEFEDNMIFQYRSLSDAVFNLFSIKNVYFVKKGPQSLVIKKLADKNQILKLDRSTRETIEAEDIIELVLTKKYKNFHVCDVDTAKLLVQKLSHRELNHLWTLFNVNPEPLLLEIFRKEDGWPVPHLFGYCGRTVTVEDCGTPLNDIQSLDWFSRVFIALQILKASEQFTFAHREFRLYLTDISPDNIVVNPRTLKISFVDLENAILQKKIDGSVYHYSAHIDEEYAFFPEEICGSHVSDHNIYAICKLLLSPSSPWPMMRNGLLHSPPSTLNTATLFDHIDLCVYSRNNTARFFHSTRIKELLTDILRIN